MKIRPAILHLLFALLLLVAQQLAMAHALAHAGTATANSTQDQSLPGESYCDQCLAATAIGSALTAALPPLPANLFDHASIRTDFVERCFPATTRPFNSRAPPPANSTI